jgi:hypothetical protein
MRNNIAARMSIHRSKGHNMGGCGKKNELPSTGDKEKPKEPSPAAVEDDDYEDGDFVTPKRDRSDDDDQPL